MIHLLGWFKPLPEWLEKAVLEGKVKVVQDTWQGKPFECLKGEVLNPLTDTIIGFK